MDNNIDDIYFMNKAMELARKGEGRTSPNPLVGAVIVKDGRIIGEGYHAYYGGNHAEVEAINNSKESVEGSTIYVNLEPCFHYGKTPPCAKRLVEEGVDKVVVAMLDPNPKVAGRGIEILKENGIIVEVGLLEKEAKELNEVFIKYITKGIPYIYLKYAMTLDGKIASITGDSKWISNEKSRQEVHKLRNKVGGIMVGLGTIIADDPSLNTRLRDGEGKDPVRIIVDSLCRIPPTAKVLNIDSDAKSIVAVTKGADPLKIVEVEKTGAEVLVIDDKGGRVDLRSLLEILGNRGIDSILIEGGGELIYSALEDELVDKVQVYIAPKIIGGSKAPTPVAGKGINLMCEAIELHDIKRKMFDENIMIEGYVRKRGE
ncbi:MAG: diaminohydroxyphosphoribosylaminopyrimidine deaminase [Fusobacteria bacterium]|nr:MAG: diaminohydroxyphosphoribosylaminopyrimidine deaminase [Fusobacteriota bacterium]KAF0230177.1 MAG: diaminohydroxyphosphoribosylaminopyrimidine [Fusobacteriota bacterium]